MIKLLRQVQRILKSTETPTSQHTADTAGKAIEEALNSLNNGQTAAKRETDASNTRQTRDTRDGEKKNKTANTIQNPKENPKGTKADPPKDNWNTVAKRGDRRKPGNVNLQKEGQDEPTQKESEKKKKPSQNKKAEKKQIRKPPAVEVVRFRINREAE